MTKRLFNNKQFNFLAKLLIAIVLLLVLCYELQSKNNLLEIKTVFLRQAGTFNIWWFLAAFALIPFNYMAETQKWYQILRRYEDISYGRAFVAVLAGVSFSLFTPNRVGEYGGRILFVKPRNRWKAIFINIVGNFAQIIVLLAFGVVGVVWFMAQYFHIDDYFIYLTIGCASIAIPLMVFAFLNIDAVIPLLKRLPYLHHIKRFVKDLRILRQFTHLELIEILAWSFIRYVIYSVQYFFILKYYGINGSIIDLFSGISAIFLFQTSIPLPPVIGLLARGNIAIHIWSYLGANEISVLAATFTLWTINLILPSFIGVLYILNSNIAKSLGYDEK